MRSKSLQLLGCLCRSDDQNHCR
uniref:Uncharacterized protein n=1 Tax=Arundo donax TaxID=35708 RepID=A0A0A9CCQ4_ARUDO